jgi:hypothetical protein
MYKIFNIINLWMILWIDYQSVTLV